MSTNTVRRSTHVSRATATHPEVHPISRVQERLWRIALVGMVLTMLLVIPGGRDMFRTPKDAAFRAAGIILMAVVAYTLVVGETTSKQIHWRDPATTISTMILVWITITTVGSTNFRYSVETLVTVVCGMVYFMVVVWTACFHRIGALWFVAIPGLINAVLVVLQQAKMWNPFDLHRIILTNPRLAATGLLGNPNDVGMVLAFAVLATVVAAYVTAGQERWIWVAVSAVLLIGLLATQTITAIVALAIAFTTLVARISPRRAAILALPIFLGLVVMTLAYKPLRMRVRYVVYSADQGQYDLLLTRRLGAFLAATEMSRDHPLTGVGPGTFGWHYFDYKLQVDQQYPGLIFRPKRTRDWTYNFGEVHNDHLEILAEAGIPGYLLFLGALVILASGSFIKRDVIAQTYTRRRKSRYEFAKAFSLPLAVLIFFLSLGQFPLQLAATTGVMLFLAGIAYSWSRHELV